MVFGNDFVVFDEHNHDMLIHKATIHEQQQHPLRAQPTCSGNNFVVIDEHNHNVLNHKATIHETIHSITIHEQ